MSSKLTLRQQQVLDCIRDSQADTGMAPTRAEIAERMGFQSKNAASDHLRALERKGYIRLHSDRSRGIQLLESALGDEDELPVVGKVAAGTPIEAVENVQRTVPVPRGLFRQRPTYLLQVQGDSMIDAGIFDGDLIAVRKSETARSGEIVVARIGEEVTVKTLRLNKSDATLLPANEDYEPIQVPADQLIIEGVFVGLIRDPNAH
ncbi:MULTISPECIES: transcriptional repressor LexA [Alcanivoracaceae]|jgi:repressor LexA|uniref:LexA repressor n=2 Tax=Alcanivoracaceae TaxID=224372 RepID=A0A9Q3VZ76_9GAMM|nr:MULTISPECIES: transcriptional repressor LexA [Alcanivoracaceae]ERS14500.1 umuDC operon protein-like protein [Alcanivorax sp. PN-3]KYZ88248.1 LexA repressor [Alcanivorax sp. KX64203]MBA4722713.1 transcriptional repressor LexA [Alcanivorax sp.]ARB45478.1 LexA repressor [Alloalcanivorax xenomutans]KAF0805404.1 LexA repressor [Alcanivorax xiamenensis]